MPTASIQIDPDEPRAGHRGLDPRYHVCFITGTGELSWVSVLPCAYVPFAVPSLPEKAVIMSSCLRDQDRASTTARSAS